MDDEVLYDKDGASLAVNFNDDGEIYYILEQGGTDITLATDEAIKIAKLVLNC